MIDWPNYIEGGIGAIVGSALTVLGFRSRMDKMEAKQAEVEKDCIELKTETLAMFHEIRGDVKKLIAISG